MLLSCNCHQVTLCTRGRSTITVLGERPTNDFEMFIVTLTSLLPSFLRLRLPRGGWLPLTPEFCV